jgi:hypothetical protein
MCLHFYMRDLQSLLLASAQLNRALANADLETRCVVLRDATLRLAKCGTTKDSGTSANLAPIPDIRDGTTPENRGSCARVVHIARRSDADAQPASNDDAETPFPRADVPVPAAW